MSFLKLFGSRKQALLLTVFFAGFFVSCADEASSAKRLDDSYEGFLRISARGETVTLEATNLKVRFSYDYYMGEHEVTFGEFAGLMGTSFDEGREDVPVSGVTMYDAVLYANALSRSLKLDPVYSYTDLSKDADGRCVFLENLVADYSADGFRLPTEAEWVFAAQKGWDAERLSWNSGNSDYEAHAVCTAGRNGYGLCDMAGNILEWTGDFLSDLGDTAVTDYVGGEAPNGLKERVVKGGSFRNSPSAITLKSRGDVYTVTSSMYADYVGFRLVRGPISSPDYAPDGGKTSDYHVTVKASSRDMKRKLGTYASTLAFRDDETGNIGFVRFASSSLNVVEISDTLDAYHPAISPDGKRVAFCTRPEGISGRSELYVRNLDANGANLVRLDVESAAIPRWRVVGADTQIVYVTSAENNSDAANWKLASTWMVPFADGKFGTPEKLFDGTFNGGVSADGKLAVGGARLLRANLDGRDTLWYNGEQACNASLSDSSKETLFLDFGSETGKAFAEKSYDAHGMLLLADSAGKLSKMIPAPEGYTFDHTEWMHGNPEYAVATLTDADGAHSKIVLVNVLDSSVLVLAEGTELWHPDLWVAKKMLRQDEIDFDLDPDSAGVYFKEGGSNPQLQMRLKMELFWTYRDSVEILALGSSRTMHGVISENISSGYTINLGHSSNDMSLIYYWAENYALNHLPRLRTLVISIDIDNWQSVDVYRNLMVNDMPGYVYDANHDFWKDGVPGDFLSAVQASYSASSFDYQSAFWLERGFFGLPGVGWGEAEALVDPLWAEKNPAIVPAQIAAFKNFLSKMKAADIRVVGIIFPQNPKYRETESWGRYGPSQAVAKDIIDSLKSYAETYPNFYLMDENKMGNHDYTDGMAHDMDHLAHDGAVQLTARLDSLLRTLK